MKRVDIDTIWEYYVLYDASTETGFAHTSGYATIPPTIYAFKTKELAMKCIQYACESMHRKNPFNENNLFTVHQFTLINSYIRSASKSDSFDEFKEGFNNL